MTRSSTAAGRVGAAAVMLAVLATGVAAGHGHEPPKVLVSTTGDHSELLKTIPITQRPDAAKRVAMSMGPGEMPSLEPGDRLELSAELYVTADCIVASPRCAGSVYHYNPSVHAELMLARGPGVTGGSHAVVLARDRVTCLQRLPNRQHHCVITFPGSSIRIPRGGRLPCTLRTCRANLVVSASDPQARGNDRLIIGANLPGGHIVQDRGRINAVRFHPAQQPRRKPLRARWLRRKLSLNPTPEVVYSQRLRGLERGEQLVARAQMLTGIAHLSYNVRISSRLMLTEGPKRIRRSPFTKRVSSLRGELTEANGFNCTQLQSPCHTSKVGVLTMRESARRRGHPVPLYVNLVVDAKAKRATAGSDVHAKVRRGGGLSVTRYPASLRG